MKTINAEIKTGQYDLVYSNRICCINSESIEIVLDFDEVSQLSVAFKFIDDEQSARYNVSSPENGKIILELFNFNNPLGIGVKNPINIAKFKDKIICLSFNVEKRQEGKPIIDFSLFIER